MAFAIGLRFYKITIKKKGDEQLPEMGPGGDPCDFIEFVKEFVSQKEEPTDEKEAQRTWYFEPLGTESLRTEHGYISYGTHGFESKIKDRKTRKPKYLRQTDDLEEVPLYFQFWCPSDATCAFAAFQSFQGRSCVSFVQKSMCDVFKSKFPEYSLRFTVLAPASAINDEAPVKALTFTRPKQFSDSADKSWFDKSLDEVDYEITVRAKKRNSILARFKDLKEMLPLDGEGFVEFDGSAYEGVRADVKFGKKRRVIGVFGSGGDAGLIDVTDTVETDGNGHPSLQSLVQETDTLMETFYAGVKT
ncbi:hypothetical protein [Agrobacterium rosae]